MRSVRHATDGRKSYIICFGVICGQGKKMGSAGLFNHHSGEYNRWLIGCKGTESMTLA